VGARQFDAAYRCPELAPVLERVVAQVEPQGLWLFGSWARGSQSACSDIDLLIEGFEGVPVLKAYDQALEAIGDCPLPLQPLVAAPSLLARLLFHRSGDR
jgi:hypothetical protein